MKREIRSGTLVGNAGPGAIVDVGQESFLIPGISTWKQSQLRVIRLDRLTNRLGKILKGPTQNNPTLEVRRFPRAMFCDRCRRMTPWKENLEVDDKGPACPHAGCGGAMVPMRFVAACESGHLADVDWCRWAHSDPRGGTGCRNHSRLSFKVDSQAGTGGLASLYIECDCGSRRSLEDLTTKSITKRIFGKCAGGHPWVHGAADCPSEVSILQRGATNLHYPTVVSALDIPNPGFEPEASAYRAQVAGHTHFSKLKGFFAGGTGDYHQEMMNILCDRISGDTGCPANVVMEIAASYGVDEEPGASTPSSAPLPLAQDALLDEEWYTIQHILQAGGFSSATFSAVAEGLSPRAPGWLNRLVGGVVLVRRLREVRSYLGFQRVKPRGVDSMVPPDVESPQNWLPACEVYGEGIAMSFDFDVLESWANALPEVERNSVRELEANRLDGNFWFLPAIDPIILALHTFSHLLIRRITFECGYTSSSLRERLYFNPKSRHAGLLLYTADGDSEGSLGGLVRQGRQDRLAQSVIEAMDQGRWCSSDPVCTETAGQGLGGFNRAACHACSLVSETSCTHANTLLDRRMLFDPTWGLIPHLEAKP